MSLQNSKFEAIFSTVCFIIGIATAYCLYNFGKNREPDILIFLYRYVGSRYVVYMHAYIGPDISIFVLVSLRRFKKYHYFEFYLSLNLSFQVILIHEETVADYRLHSLYAGTRV